MNFTSTKTFVPGAPSGNSGPTWAKTLYDHLRLPSGKTIGETSNEELRTLLGRLNIEGAHRDGRMVIAERFAAVCTEVFNRAGHAALAAWLDQHKA